MRYVVYSGLEFLTNSNISVLFILLSAVSTMIIITSINDESVSYRIMLKVNQAVHCPVNK